MTRRAGACADLYHERGQTREMDVCRLAAGHEGHHVGAHRGLHWIKGDNGKRIIGWEEKQAAAVTETDTPQE